MTPKNARTSRELSVDELRLLGEAIDGSPSPLTLYDQDYRIVYANETSRKLWPELHFELSKGVGLEKAAYEAAKVLFPGASEATIRKAADYVLMTFKSEDAHEMMANGGCWVKLTHHKIMDRAVAGIGVDITDLKKREKDLERAQKAQADLIEVLGYGLLVVNKAGEITVFNSAYQQYCRTFGFEVYEGMPVKQLTKQFYMTTQFPISDEQFDRWFEGFYADRFNVGKSFEEEFSLADGRHILRHQHYREHVGNIITIADITEIKDAQLRAESAEKSKSEFLANMSHEIRTPMNGVIGMAHLLSKCDLGENERQLVELIQRSGKALMTVINDILDFSKIEAGRVVLEEEMFSIRHCVTDVVALLTMAAARKDVELTVNIQPGLPESFLGDAGRIRQVITNIIGNAVKFTEKGSVRIDISGKPIGEKFNLLVTVKDTGIGIPEAMLDKIFNKFQQADGSNSRKFEGTGLGLSIARHLVSLMDGDIQVESELGNGTRFDIRLPLTAACNVLDHKKVLIVDRRAKSRESLAEQISDLGGKSVPVGSLNQGFLALDLARNQGVDFDLIIWDVPVPPFQYDSFIEKLQAVSARRAIPVILVQSPENIRLEISLKEAGLLPVMTETLDASVVTANIHKERNFKQVA